MWRKFSTLVLAFTVLLASSGVQPTYSQGQEVVNFPPRIIDIWPMADIPLAPSDPLTITFDQPMQATTVEVAFKTVPRIVGDLTWSDPQTLNFRPPNGWPHSTIIQVTIGTYATSDTGLHLETPYTFQITTAGPLAVTGITPEHKAVEVKKDTQISVTFDRPVVPLGTAETWEKLPAPFTISPQIIGKGRWLNTALYVFTPDEMLPSGAKYTVTVPAGLTASDGTKLDRAVQSTFITQRPKVVRLRVSPDRPWCSDEHVGLHCGFTIMFDQAMDRTSTQNAFSFTESFRKRSITGKFIWKDDNKSFTFYPSKLLALSNIYRVTLAAWALNDIKQSPLKEAFSQTISTQQLPGVAYIDPVEGELELDQALRIYFRTPMELETVAKRIRVEPTPLQITFLTNHAEGLYFDFNFEKKLDMRYTITLLAGAEDRYGNKIEQDYKVTRPTPSSTPPEDDSPQAKRDQAIPILNGTIMTLGVYDPDASIDFLVQGKGTLELKIYQMSQTDLSKLRVANVQFDGCPGVDGTTGYGTVTDGSDKIQESRLVRSWSEHFDVGYQNDQVRFNARIQPSGTDKLKPGIYLVSVAGPGYGWGGTYSEFVLVLATANLTVKRSTDSIFVWVTDIASAKPVANVPVTVYHQGAPTLLGTTNDKGVVQATFKTPPQTGQYYEPQLDHFYILAERDDVFGEWYSCYIDPPVTQAKHLYTDRPIYRPGETVYIKGVIRDRQDAQYSIPGKKVVTLRLVQGESLFYQAKVLQTVERPVSDFGTFDAEFNLPADAVGNFGVILGTDEENEAERVERYYGYYWLPTYVAFNVAAFRAPEYDIALNAIQSSIIQGESVDVMAATSYYSGGGVNGARVKWKTFASPTTFAPPSYSSYQFVDERWPNFDYGEMDGGSVLTNAEGKAIFTVTNSIFPKDIIVYLGGGRRYPGDYSTLTDEDPPPGMPPFNLVVEGTVQDESRIDVSSNISVPVHPANVYVGLDTTVYGAVSGQPTTIKVIALRPDGTPVANQTIQLYATRYSWEYLKNGYYDDFNPRWQEVHINVLGVTVTTGQDGTAQAAFTPPASGRYRISAQTADEQGRINSSTQRVYVSGRQHTQWNDPLLDMNLTTNKASYRPGELADIIIPTGFSGHSLLLVTTERASVVTYEVVEANEPLVTYKLPITDVHAPNVYVTVTAYQGSGNGIVPDYRAGKVMIKVEPVARRLKLKLTPSSTYVEPRGKITFDILVTDQRDKPVRAELSLALVDKSVLALVKPNAVTLEEAFYSQNEHNVRTHLSMHGYIPLLNSSYIVPCCFGGGGGDPGPREEPQPTVRTNFKFTAFWSPYVHTDDNGKASVTITVPDNATTWQLDTRALTRDMLVGEDRLDTIATLPLLIRPVTPRFFVAGDRVQLAAVINNNTDTDQSVKATLQATGVLLTGSSTQEAQIASGRRVRVTWDAVVTDAQSADLTFIAIGQNGAQDAAKPPLTTGPNSTIPIYQYVADERTGTAGALFSGDTRIERISLIPRLHRDSGELVVRTESSLAAATTDALNYLESFPHDCIEQTTSKFLPNAMTYRALEMLHLDNSQLKANLEEQIRKALIKLKDGQNSEGGWGWFPQQHTDLLVTAYATYALLQLRESDLMTDMVKDFKLGRALKLLQQEIPEKLDKLSRHQLNRLAFYHYVLALGSNDDTDRLLKLFAIREKLSFDARAYLLMALHLVTPGTIEITKLAVELENAAISSSAGAYWKETERDSWNWSTDTRTTALVLDALLKVKPESKVLPDAVRWLMAVRVVDHWETTQETTWSVIALTNWLVKTGELEGEYSYQVAINQKSLLDANVTPDTIREVKTQKIAVTELLLNRANTLTVERSGDKGALYYTATLRAFAPASQAKSFSRGVTVTREYLLGDKQSFTPINTAKVGELVTVRLTFTVNETLNYFVLEDYFPAGAQGADTSLLTTTLQAKEPQFSRERSGDYYWYWGWWYLDKVEMRDARLSIYADYLPKGTYTFTYQIQPLMSGQFQTMPARGYAFYEPDVFGQSDGLLFTIQPSNEAS